MLNLIVPTYMWLINMDTIKLKRCPWCGRKPRVEHNQPYGEDEYFSVYCELDNVCSGEPQTNNYATFEEAAEAWNNEDYWHYNGMPKGDWARKLGISKGEMK